MAQPDSQRRVYKFVEWVHTHTHIHTNKHTTSSQNAYLFLFSSFSFFISIYHSHHVIWTYVYLLAILRSHAGFPSYSVMTMLKKLTHTHSVSHTLHCCPPSSIESPFAHAHTFTQHIHIHNQVVGGMPVELRERRPNTTR
jgi:hypothetical protein